MDHKSAHPNRLPHMVGSFDARLDQETKSISGAARALSLSHDQASLMSPQPSHSAGGRASQLSNPEPIHLLRQPQARIEPPKVNLQFSESPT